MNGHGFRTLLFTLLAGVLAIAQADDSLIVYCGAGLRPAVQPLIERFQKETGVKSL